MQGSNSDLHYGKIYKHWCETVFDFSLIVLAVDDDAGQHVNQIQVVSNMQNKRVPGERIYFRLKTKCFKKCTTKVTIPSHFRHFQTQWTAIIKKEKIRDVIIERLIFCADFSDDLK